jgi:L-rhamnose mutarotase
MSYHINAWLEDGMPRLQVIDAQTRTICMSWSYTPNKDQSYKERHEIQRLFKELLLLTCKQDISNCRIFNVKPQLN